MWGNFREASWILFSAIMCAPALIALVMVSGD